MISQEDADWPLFGWIDDIRPTLAGAVERGEASVLATIYATEGACPRGVGTQMLFTPTSVAGYFSGSCIEADVARHAQGVLGDGAPQRLIYGRGSPWIDIRLACGGRLEILLERLLPESDAVGALLSHWHARAPVVWESDGLDQNVRALADEAPFGLRAEPWGIRRAYTPPVRLIVIGSDPAALAMASLGAETGFDVALVRENGPETPMPINGLAYHREPAGVLFSRVQLDRWTAVAFATHDPAADHAALAEALTSDAFYVGALGARAGVPERKAYLARTIPQAAIDRLRAPIGLEGCGKAPRHVAISVVADILQTAQRLKLLPP